MATVTGHFPTHTDSRLLKTIRSLGFLSMENGPWAAGGAVRRLLCDEMLGGADIDIFLSSQPQATCQPTRVEAAITGRGDCIEKQTPYRGVTDFKLCGPPKGPPFTRVQMITNRTFASAAALIDDFDLTVCMAVTDGWSWMVDQRFLDHTKEKKLVVNNAEQRGNNPKRIAKYCLYGFMPLPGTFGTLIGLHNGTLLKKLENNDGMLSNAPNY